MNRAMFSGVAGLKTHQVKMDVIGNNIANVNTFGYKAQRAVFSDVYYQTLTGASAPNAQQGGTNPSSVGYGSSLSAIQTQMSTSSMQTTGFGLDVAIQGEGFLQVQDGGGNIYYTKAGMLNIDSAGNLIDVKGNFVLGADAAGNPGANLINLINGLAPVPPSPSTATNTINGIPFTVTASENSADGNVAMSFTSSNSVPAGANLQVEISETGSISVLLNPSANFTSLADLSTQVNAAITQEMGGQTHPGGNFTISGSTFPAGGLTGEQITGVAGGTDLGELSTNSFFNGLMMLEEVSTGFTGNGAISDVSATYAAGPPEAYNVSMTIGGVAYTGTIEDGVQSNSLILKNGTGDDFIQVSNPKFDAMNAQYPGGSGNVAPAGATATPSVPSENLGLGTQMFSLQGGTEGGPVTLDQLSNITIGTDGSITFTHDYFGIQVGGQISLANFANPEGLQLAGDNYFIETVNSGTPIHEEPGLGGTGSLKSSSLEMSNVDLSEQFADMITTQRGFQANSRVITVTDTMLEELINLKR